MKECVDSYALKSQSVFTIHNSINFNTFKKRGLMTSLLFDSEESK